VRAFGPSSHSETPRLDVGLVPQVRARSLGANLGGGSRDVEWPHSDGIPIPTELPDWENTPKKARHIVTQVLDRPLISKIMYQQYL
jgi:hypothetical protein